jgi:hypothetical protein
MVISAARPEEPETYRKAGEMNKGWIIRWLERAATMDGATPLARMYVSPLPTESYTGANPSRDTSVQQL